MAAYALLTPVEAAAQTQSVTGSNSHGTFLADGRRFFPIGLTMPPPLGSTTPWGRAALPELVGAGVTLYRTGAYIQDWTGAILEQTRAWNAAAAAHGVYTWVNLRELNHATSGSKDERKLRQVVEALRSDAGMGFWKGEDEPWPLFGPDALTNAYRIVKELDPNHVFLTIFAPRSRDMTMFIHAPDPPDLRGYAAVTDAAGVDVYPIYYRLGLRMPKLHMVGAWTRAILRSTGVAAFTTTLQICHAGSDDPGGSGRYVLPTRRQERYMIYDAILNGARGLVFYGGELRHCMTDSDKSRGWNWAFWRRVLGGLVREIGNRSPLHAALLRPETTTRLRTSLARTRAITRRVGANDLWVLATHTGPHAATVSLRGLPLWARNGRVYPSGDAISARAGSLRDHFRGWGVRVYRFRR